MILTTENGEIKIEIGSEIFVNCLITDKKGEALTVKINGHCNGEINPKITLNHGVLIGNSFQIGRKIFVSFEVVAFQGIKPVLRFPTDNRKITLNNIKDISGLA